MKIDYSNLEKKINIKFKDRKLLIKSLTHKSYDKIGKPYFFNSKKITNLVKKKFKVKNFDLFLSISDEKDYSIAFTILQKKK